jgi:hypothetical protein
MQEETVTAVRYSPILGREVVFRLTYNVSEGPGLNIVRRFLVREEVLTEDSLELLPEVKARG